MVRTQIQLREEQIKLLKKLSEKEHVSIAELIRQGVNVLLKRVSLIDEAAQRKRAIAVAGRFHSGRKDMSTRHDDYITEAYRR